MPIKPIVPTAANHQLQQLRQENDRLLRLASHDELTGILNRRATEQRIIATMKRGGALLVCDLDRFKLINDRYGHLTGDEALKTTAKLLTYILRQSDVLGRVGGDEFVIFAYGVDSQAGVERIIEKVNSRFASHNEREPVQLNLTIGAAIFRPDDTYEALFDRADQQLIALKECKRRGEDPAPQMIESWFRDMNQIQQELAEQIAIPGAFCQDYESFKSIYRFLERGMRRNNQKACLVLMSLVDSRGHNVIPMDKSEQMDRLGDVLQDSLRLGDVFTRYSSCQYLVLLMDVNTELAEMVSDRVRSSFLRRTSDRNLLFHYCYELQQVQLPERKPE